jgi:GntR family transcriptional regulator
MLNDTGSLALLPPGSEPLHFRAEQALRQLITAPEYADGSLLPDELTVANRLGVSRGTVRAAFSRLVAEGKLERKAGIGTRVVQRSTESAIGAWRSFSREMARRGIKLQMFRLLLQDVLASREVALALRVKVGTVVQRLDRVRGWEDTPVLRSRSWFHPRVRFGRDERFRRPLYELVNDISGLTAMHAREEFDAECAGALLAKDLQVKPGSPLLRRRHTVFDLRGRPFEFAEVHYVSGRFTLTVDMKCDVP